MSSFVSGSVNSPKNNYLSLQDLEQNDRFIHRHIGPSKNEITQMLDKLGMSSLDELNPHVRGTGIAGQPY